MEFDTIGSDSLNDTVLAVYTGVSLPALSQVAANDDSGNNREAGLETHHADSYIRAHIATGGTYYLQLGDVQQHGGPEYAYRLRVSAPRPDFELRIAPSAINLSPGETVPVAVYAVRKDGFSGDITLSLTNAPAGFILSGAQIASSRDSAAVTLAALPEAPRGRIALRLQGRATINGREVVREAVPTEDMMQAFLWRHLVPAADLSANVASAVPSRRPIMLVGKLPVTIPAGSFASIRVDVDTQGLKADGPVQFELVDPPEGISVQPAPTGAVAQLVLACDSKKLKPGFSGNLIANAFVMVTPPPRAPFVAKPRPSRADLMQALKEAPTVPGEMPVSLAQPDPYLDGTSAEPHSSAQPTNAPSGAKSERAPPVLEQPPPQKIALGMLPAIVFEIVQP